MTATAVKLSASTRQSVAKRTLDLTLAATALVILSPLLAAIWVAVRLTSRGPAVFKQERLGLDKRPFIMLKFRSMTVGNSDAVHREYVSNMLTTDGAGSEKVNGLYKLAGDPRVTRIGKFLRKSSLDELPQLVNVVRGDMSLVGPRPVLAWEADLFRPEIMTRFDTRPGITGLWQVSGRSLLTMPQALALDVEYVRRRTFWFDVLIILKTIPAQLKRGAV